MQIRAALLQCKLMQSVAGRFPTVIPEGPSTIARPSVRLLNVCSERSERNTFNLKQKAVTLCGTKIGMGQMEIAQDRWRLRPKADHGCDYQHAAAKTQFPLNSHY